MKKPIQIFTLVMLIVTMTKQLKSQVCATNIITLSTQADVDNFMDNYNCIEITGNLRINATDITNLDGLSNLTTIGGGLDIYNNGELTNVNGLTSLTTIGEDLFIGDNEILTNVDGLSSLTTIGGFLSIQSNDKLDRYCGLYTLISTPDPGGLSGSYTVNSNHPDNPAPTEQDILDLGEACPVAPDVEIPTMGEWGLGVLFLLMGIFGVVYVREKRAVLLS